ncbi:hypothetical protein JS528_06065 [Bifidobacterium sp. MA2]|uniref:Uncharacterized protein n=1 Tax=Bifidobacterium santillanense TaxID=2809028 RepID=A0ABS5UPR1_9BIFI|nr:hypothetical protein [Bifidobacterium santillanense]MBT1172926.1 hypothetical protein [Bifidobacterium santillanense]
MDVEHETNRTPLEERFPALAQLDAMSDEQRIEALGGALDALRRELDEIGK